MIVIETASVKFTCNKNTKMLQKQTKLSMMLVMRLMQEFCKEFATNTTVRKALWGHLARHRSRPSAFYSFVEETSHHNGLFLINSLLV